MQKRVFITGLLLLLSSFTLPALSHEQGSGSGIQEARVTAAALNVRTGPSTRYRAIGVVHRGEPVEILDSSGGWYRIRSHGLTGWASGSYIRPVAYAEHRHEYDDDDYGNDRYRDYDDRDYDRDYDDRRHAGRFAVIGPNRFGYANMFDGPGRNYRIIARLREGERVRIIDRGRRWTLVGKRGVGRGYVRSGFLTRY